MARALYAGACRDYVLVAWMVMWDLPTYPERYAARLVTSSTPLPLPAIGLLSCEPIASATMMYSKPRLL